MIKIRKKYTLTLIEEDLDTGEKVDLTKEFKQMKFFEKESCWPNERTTKTALEDFVAIRKESLLQVETVIK